MDFGGRCRSRGSGQSICGSKRDAVIGLRYISSGLALRHNRSTKTLSSSRAIAVDTVRIAFALDCCDREAIGFAATTEGITGEDVRDLMVTAVEHRFGPVNRLPATIEWLTDNGSGYIAHDTKRFARDIGFEPRTTPVESPQSNGMAEAFVRTMKRDYARVSQLPDAAAVIRQLPVWFETLPCVAASSHWC